MSNKQIQKQRMKRYFIDAAKEIIKEGDVNSLTARKVGDRAGYSYATIYNYFSDIKELLAYCAFDYLEECYNYMMEFKSNDIDCKEQLLIYSVAYINYFAKNPNIYQLIFVEDLELAPQELTKNNKQLLVGTLLKETIVKCYKAGYIEEEDMNILPELIKSSIHGKLLMFIKGRNTNKVKDVIFSVENEIKFLIKKDVKNQNKNSM